LMTSNGFNRLSAHLVFYFFEFPLGRNVELRGAVTETAVGA
jgi:hypothetical protein